MIYDAGVNKGFVHQLDIHTEAVMPTTRTTILVLVSIIVSALVAGTALADPPPDPTASSTSSASPPPIPPPPALPDWAVCMSKCEASGKLVCGSPADIQKACSDIPECAALSADQAKAVNGFCDQCRESQKNCDTATPPVVTPTTPTPTTPTPKPTTPVTPEQTCLMQGGVLVDGVCMTVPRMAKELIQLRKDVDALKGKQDATDKEIAAIKARIDAVEKAKGLPDNLKDYIKSQLDPNMKWVKSKFEQVDYRMDLMDVSNAALSQRIDNQAEVIGGINDRVKKVERGSQSGFLGFQAGGFFLGHPASLEGDTIAEVGGKVRWVPKLVEHLRLPIGIGGAYGTETDNGSSTVLHIEGGLMVDVAKFFHLEGGFIMDRAFVEDGATDWSFMGGYFQPEVCIPNDLTACLQATAAVGGMSAFRSEEKEVSTKIDGALGLSVVISYLPY